MIRADFTVVSVRDGDSFRVNIPDLGGIIPGIKAYERAVRLLGVNAAELNEKGGAAARDTLREFLGDGSGLYLLVSGHLDKFGRLLGDAVDSVLLGQTASALILSLPGSRPISLRAQLAPVV